MFHINIQQMRMQSKLICSVKQIDFLCKVNWFARQNKLICREEQLSFETCSSSLAHEYHRDSRAKSLKLPSKFIEFADQIQWNCWPNSMNLQNSALSFWLSCTCNGLVLLVAKQRWRYAIFALEGGAEVALVLVTQMIADGGNGFVGVAQQLHSHFHAQIKQVAEHGSAKRLFETFLQRTFVGADEKCQAVETGHALIVVMDEIAGVVHLDLKCWGHHCCFWN